MTIISHGLSCRYDELCLSEALYPAPLARPFSKGLLAGDCLTFAFIQPVGSYPLCCHANSFPTICDYRQSRSPLEKGAAKGRDRRKRQLSNFCVAGEGNC